MLVDGGALVFSGAVGSGKSTTLASLIAGVPDDRKVITLEDPVEYVIPRAIQNTVARDLFSGSGAAYTGKLMTLKRSAMRSEERRVGNECVGTCRYRWSPYNTKKKKNK